MWPSGIVYVAVLVSAVYALPRTFDIFNNPCTQYPYRYNYPDDQVADYDVDMTCTNGTLYWNYPIGNTNIHFRGNSSFSVCFHDALGGDFLELTDVTDGDNKRLPAFNRSEPDMEYCLWSTKNRVDIKMHSTVQAYMSSILYLLH